MQYRDDNSLLREYAEQDSEDAFAALVTRHINTVYSVALRHTGNPHEAEEIAQVVFVILAKKSRKLAKGVILSGWLYQTARLTSVTFIRSEIRRARHHREAFMQTQANETAADLWPQISPLLDAAMAELGEKDRHALVLRYFDQKSMRQVGETLGASEDAAKKRVARALEKLQKFFFRRGVISTTAAIADVISAKAVQVAPAGLSKAAVALAVAKTTAVSGSTFTLMKGVLKVMAWTKAQTTITLSLGVFLVGTGAYQTHRAAKLNTQNHALQQQKTALTEQVRELQKQRDDATDQLASQADEAAQNDKDNSELLKLRGEVAQLRPLQQQLAQLKNGAGRAASETALEVTGPNKVLFDSLGDPVPPPPDLNHAYTREGLEEALQSAASNAGVNLKRIEIDD